LPRLHENPGREVVGNTPKNEDDHDEDDERHTRSGWTFAPRNARATPMPSSKIR
jgi:hypothetical protein